MPQSAPPAPTTTAPEPNIGPFRGVLSRLEPASRAGGRDILAKSALPALALVARRLPVGLALLGVAAAGVALANPKSRARIFAAGRSGLASLRG